VSVSIMVTGAGIVQAEIVPAIGHRIFQEHRRTSRRFH
jgi:hypothetical protein